MTAVIISIVAWVMITVYGFMVLRMIYALTRDITLLFDVDELFAKLFGLLTAAPVTLCFLAIVIEITKFSLQSIITFGSGDLSNSPEAASYLPIAGGVILGWSALYAWVANRFKTQNNSNNDKEDRSVDSRNQGAE